MNVPAQTDKEFAEISSNQCSWVAWNFARHSRDLMLAHMQKDEKKFLEMYNECMMDGSLNRAPHQSARPFGENIDNQALLEANKDIMIVSKMQVIKETPEAKMMLSMVSEDVRKEAFTEKYGRRNDLTSELHMMSGRAAMLVNRHGQSFTVLPYLGNYLILDSHLHETKVLSLEEANKYCLADNGGYLFLTAMVVLL
jgi:hypothetical protein